MSDSYLPLLTCLTIIAFALLAGPVFGIPATPSNSSCSLETAIGTGLATVTVTDLPDSAVIERSRFGAKAWRLTVDPAQVDVGPVSGRPTVTYKLRVDGEDLGLAVASTAILSRCHETTRIAIDESQFSPRSLDHDTYNGTIKVTYRGTRGGDDVEERLATKNVTVQVNR